MTTLPITYAKLVDSLASGLVNFHSDTFKAMLLAAYTEGTDASDAQFLADVLAHATQATGTGYTAGGAALSTVTWTQSGSGWTLDCDDVIWPASSIAAAFAVFYDSSPSTDATRPLLGYWDLGGTVTSSATDFTLAINAAGLLTFTAT